jgi:uncharacterized OB-fold protein
MTERIEFAIAPGGPWPEPDEHSAVFWAGLTEGRIILQDCEACGKRRFPRLPACPFCATPGGVDADAPGTGTVYSFVRAHRALTPAFAAVAPYAVAAVDLDGGARIFGRVQPTEDCAIGARVEPAFVDHPKSEHSPAWTELCFTITPT